MVITKKSKEKATFEQLEKESSDEVNKVKCKQQKLYGEMLSKTNDAGFYFSIVFARREERDEWLKIQGLKLVENEYILAKDHDITVRRRQP